MLPPHPLALASATCAAASLAGRLGDAGEPASVQAAADLARHAALDAHAALSARSPRPTRRLTTRAARRLRYSYALTARLLTDHVPAGATAAAIFIEAASAVARDSAALATANDGRLQARALRALRRSSRLQEDVALELSSARSSGSLEDLINALATALDAQDVLLAALGGAVSADGISPRRRDALKARAARADLARDGLRSALTVARSALSNALSDVANS